MPSTAFVLIGFVGTEPSLVSFEIGTWITIECTFSVASVSTLEDAAIDSTCRFWNGRSTPRSKIEPRST